MKESIYNFFFPTRIKNKKKKELANIRHDILQILYRKKIGNNFPNATIFDVSCSYSEISQHFIGSIENDNLNNSLVYLESKKSVSTQWANDNLGFLEGRYCLTSFGVQSFLTSSEINSIENEIFENLNKKVVLYSTIILGFVSIFSVCYNIYTSNEIDDLKEKIIKIENIIS